jgi:hypothetical protein
LARLAGVRGHVLEIGIPVAAILAIAAGPPAVRWIGQLGDLFKGKPTLTVQRLGPDAVAGQIARGTIDGQRWQVRLMSGKSWNGIWQCAPDRRWATDCQIGFGYLWKRHFPFRADPVFFGEASNPDLVARVRPDVTVLDARLSDGDVVRLWPVTAYGRRWIGLVLPDGVSVDKVTAYSGSREIAHSVPYIAAYGRYSFLTWLRPGDPGPARATRVVDATVVPGDMLNVGPWGTCIGYPSAYSCWPVGYRVTDWAQVYPNDSITPHSSVIAVRPDAAYLLLTLTNHRTMRVPVVKGSGVGFVAVKVLAHPSIARWALFNAAGDRLSGGNGPPDRMTP